MMWLTAYSVHKNPDSPMITFRGLGYFQLELIEGEMDQQLSNVNIYVTDVGQYSRSPQVKVKACRFALCNAPRETLIEAYLPTSVFKRYFTGGHVRRIF